MVVTKIVSFDVGGTLVDFHYANLVWNEAMPQLYARKRSISFEEARNYVLEEYNRVGSKDVRWYLPEYWFRHFDLNEDPMEVFRSYSDEVRIYPEAPSVLRNLNEKYDLIVASGTPRPVVDIMIEKLSHFFKRIFSSISDCGEVRKTTRFYSMICEVLDVEPRAMVHVGDDWDSDFVTPRKLGIKSFYLDRAGEKSGKFVIKDLKEMEKLLFDLSVLQKQK